MEARTVIVAVTLVLAVPAAGAAVSGGLALEPTQPQQDNTVVNKAAKSGSAPIAQSDPALLGRTDSTLVSVVVKLDYEPVTNYDGDIPGLAATNPQKTGKKLTQNQAAVEAYTRYASAYESEVVARIKARIQTARVQYSFRTIYGGVAMTLPANRIDDLLTIDGVVAVRRDAVEQPTGAALR